MHEFHIKNRERREGRCPPGTGFVIGAIAGAMFWLGFALGGVLF